MSKVDFKANGNAVLRADGKGIVINGNTFSVDDEILGGGTSADVEQRLENLESIADGYAENILDIEVDTGREWVTGKRIYRYITRKQIVPDGNFHIIENNIVGKLHLELMVDMKTICDDRIKMVANGMFAQSDNSRLVSYIYNNDLNTAVGNSFATTSEPIWVIVVLEYTKSN